MISLTLTNVKSFMSHLLLKETFDNFSFIEGEIITFNIFRIDGYIQKDFFDSEEEISEYSLWKNHDFFLLEANEKIHVQRIFPV